MTYTNIIATLFVRFPFLEQRYIDEGDYIFGLAHLCYAFVFVPYIREVIENNDVGAIAQVSGFLEEMIVCTDELVSELAVVSVLENILPERSLVATLKTHLQAKTKEWLLSLEKAYGWDNEHA